MSNEPGAIIERTFHLGKKAYSYQLENEKDVILLGNSQWDRDREECKLTFFYLVVDAGAPLELEGIPENANVLGVYKSRSGKFKTGQFRDFDSQRYIKSRYRETFRAANRQRSGEAVLQIFEDTNAEYLRNLTSASSDVTSAEEAEERFRAQTPENEAEETSVPTAQSSEREISPELQSVFGGAPVSELPIQ